MTAGAGLIVRAASRTFTAEIAGERHPVRLPKRHRYHDDVYVDPVAVGDRVEVERRGEEWVIGTIHPRRNGFSRPASGRRGKRQLLAANVDLALVVMAAAEPAYKPATIDRYLVLASSGGVPAAVCINKVDLDPSALDHAEVAAYRDLGVEVVSVSARTGEGLDALRGLAAAKVCVVIGPSGVGKSSLIQALAPGIELRTGEISRRTGKGQHTTTWVEMWPLSSGGRLIDSPGLRVLDLTGLDPDRLGEHFPDLHAVASGCRFGDCIHLSEPGCAVKEAVADGRLAAFRYDSYVRIRASLLAGQG